MGHIGSKELAAAALASSICNVTGISIVTGLSYAVTTLTSQSKGDMERRRRTLKQRQKELKKAKREYPYIYDEKKVDVENGKAHIVKRKMGYGSTLVKDIESDSAEDDLYPITPKTYLFRGLFVQLMFVLPIGLYWIYGMKSLMVFLGQEETIAEMAEDYLRILAPGLWSYGINFTLCTWLQAIELADIPIYGVAVGTILHIPFNLFFIHTVGWGYKGAAVATSIFQIVQPTVTFLYIWLTESGKDRIYFNTGADVFTTSTPLSIDVQRAICSYEGIFQYLGLAIPGVVHISEWWAMEMTVFLSGHLPFPDIALSAMTIYQNMVLVCLKQAAGSGVACETRVSTLLGFGDAHGTKFACRVSLVFQASLGLVLGAILYFIPHSFFPSLFTPDINIIQEVVKTIPYMILFVFADGLQSMMRGMIKGCGRRCVIMPIVIFSDWVVGLPLAYYVTFRWSNISGLFEDLRGLIFGMVVGCWVLCLLLLLVVEFGIDWDEEVAEAQERLQFEHMTEIGSKSDLTFEDDEQTPLAATEGHIIM